VGFSLAYCFKYSARPGTESSELEDDVPKDVKERRLSELLQKTGPMKSAETAGAAA
jgi:tRNA A37 methylthiotransferase MiaB